MESWSEKMVLKMFILLARLFVIGFFSFFFVTPFYILFYLIIFQNTELLDEISIKFYVISYSIFFVGYYIQMSKEVKKDEKPIDKGL
jgi:hypothetical protein